jgi:hypothetical protein
VSVQLATYLHVLVEWSSAQLAGSKVKNLEKNLSDAKKEIAQLKTDLGEARGLKKAAENRASSLKKEMAEKIKEIDLLLSKSEAAAKEDAQTISKLKTDLASAESSAISRFRSSPEFETEKLEFASSWVFDTVSQCRRLVKERLGVSDLGFLAPLEIARVVEARRKAGAEIEIGDEGSSEDEEDVAEVPSSTIPVAAGVAAVDPSSTAEGNTSAV